MLMKFVIPTSDAQAPGLKAEAAPEKGTVQRCGLIVPGKKVSAAIKKKVNTKRLNKRQARRREKPVTIPLERYLRLVAQPCVYCGAVGSTGVDRVRNSESYTRENSVPCCGPCNIGKAEFRTPRLCSARPCHCKSNARCGAAREKQFDIKRFVK